MTRNLKNKKVKNKDKPKEFFEKYRFAIFLAFVFTFGSFSYGLNQVFDNNTPNQKASVFEVDQESKKEAIQIIKNILQKNNKFDINKIKNVSGGEKFINDLKNFTEVYNMRFEEVPEGFLVSFLGSATKGDTIHPYFGFFKVKNGNLIKILWSQNSKAKIIQMNDGVIEIQNMSDFSWNTKNIWENYSTGLSITLESKNGHQFVEPGKIGVFTVSKDGVEDFVPQNMTHGYLVIFE